MTAEWPPLVAGGMIGLLSMATLLASDKPLGVSTAYARLAGIAGRRLHRGYTMSLDYFRSTVPFVDWEVMLLFGVVIGGFLGAISGGQFHPQLLPNLWESRFGHDSLGLRLGTALVGGGVMAFGARVAGGCTSGHGISGALHLSPGSWLALFAFFLGGMPVAYVLYRM